MRPPSDAGVTIAERAEARLAVTSAWRPALAVVESLYRVAGTSGIFQTSPLHRIFQDLHVMSQQLFARPSHYENVGRYLLGLGARPLDHVTAPAVERHWSSSGPASTRSRL